MELNEIINRSVKIREQYHKLEKKILRFKMVG